MAITVEIFGPPGETGGSVKLFKIGSDTVEETVSTVTENTNKKGTYTFVTTVDPGDYDVVFFDSGSVMLSISRRRIRKPDGTYAEQPLVDQSVLLETTIKSIVSTSPPIWELEDGFTNDDVCNGNTVNIRKSGTSLTKDSVVAVDFTASNNNLEVDVDAAFTAAVNDVVQIMSGSTTDNDAIATAVHEYDYSGSFPAGSYGEIVKWFNEMIELDGISPHFTAIALQHAPTGSGAGFLQGSWDWSTDTAETDPGAGTIKVNNATYASVTEVYISETTASNYNAQGEIAALKAGDGLLVATTGDGSKFIRMTLTAEPVDNGGWYSITVSIDDSGPALTNNKAATVQFQYKSLTVDEDSIVTKVWDRILSGNHDSAGSAGEVMQGLASDALTAQDVWDYLLTNGKTAEDQLMAGGSVFYDGFESPAHRWNPALDVYNFESSTRLKDLVGSNNAVMNAMDAGNWTDDNGLCVTFNGTDEFLDLGLGTSLSNREAFTISMWFRVASLAAVNELFNCHADATNGIAIQVDTNGDVVVEIENGAGLTANTFDTNLSVDTWYHIAVVYDGTQATAANRVKCWLNGGGTTRTAGSDPPTRIPSLGAARMYFASDDGVTTFCNCRLSDLAMFFAAKTQAEVGDIYVAGRSGEHFKPITPVDVVHILGQGPLVTMEQTIWNAATSQYLSAGTMGYKVANASELVEADIRTAVGLAAANLDEQLFSISQQSAPDAATVASAVWNQATLFAGNAEGSYGKLLKDAKDRVDALPLVDSIRIEMDNNSTQLAYLVSAIDLLEDLSLTEVEDAVEQKMEAIHLHRLLAAQFDATSMPGDSTSLLRQMIENGAGLARFTTASLVNAPTGSGGGGTGDWTETEKENIRYRLGVDGAKTTPTGNSPELDLSIPTVTEITSGIDANSTQVALAVSQTAPTAIRAAVGLGSANLDDQLASLGGSLGSGANTVTITVTDGTNPLQNARVRLEEGLNVVFGETDAAGQIVFSLDDATYSANCTKTGYTPVNGQSVVVSGATANTIVLATNVITPPSSAQVSTGVLIAYDETITPEVGVQFTCRLQQDAGSTGESHDTRARVFTADGSGLVQFTDMLRGATYNVWRGDETNPTGNPQVTVVIPDAASFNMPSGILGFDVEA